MKRPDSFLTNTATATGRAEGEAVNNPGDNSGTGMDSEIYNDPAYALIGQISSYKEDGLSNADETTADCDLRDSMEEMTEKAVKGVVDWDSTTTFGIGDNCMSLGYQWVSYVASNQNNIPLSNPDRWMLVPNSRQLLEEFFNGTLKTGAVQGVHDRAGSNYQTSIFCGDHRIGPAGSDFYEAYIVHLDGSIVTGDTALEAILDPGGANEHPYIDIIAPDVAGTRTLIDAGDYVVTPQSSSGDADTVGALVEDQFQGHVMAVTDGGSASGSPYDKISTSTGALVSTAKTQGPVTDGINGTPRTGTTTHGKRLTGGAAYIISMIPA